MFSKIAITKSTNNYWDDIEKVKIKIQSAEAILIGAGAGLSLLPDLLIPGNGLRRTSRIS